MSRVVDTALDLEIVRAARYPGGALQAAKSLGLHASRVYAALHRAGIHPREAMHDRDARLIEAHLKGETVDGLAEDFCLSRRSVYRIIEKYGFNGHPEDS